AKANAPAKISVPAVSFVGLASDPDPHFPNLTLTSRNPPPPISISHTINRPATIPPRCLRKSPTSSLTISDTPKKNAKGKRVAKSS
ncbi:hypothetical protein HII31_02635, partial [Pseudocercospora fuligena]